MKLAILLLASIVYLSGIEKGWNLIGSSSEINIKDIVKKNKYITKAITYKNGKWSDDIVISRTDGIWVFSTLKSHNIELPFSKKTNNIISFIKGWNLKSLPNNQILSPFMIDKDIFYFDGNKWLEFSDKKKSLISLKPHYGLWVYSKNNIEINTSNLSLINPQFKDKKELYSYIENIVIQNKQFIFERSKLNCILPTKEAFKGGSQSSKTNTQESNVDEIDLIKTNNENVFYVDKKKVIISSFEDIISGRISKNFISFDNEPSGIYLWKNKLFIFISQNKYDAYSRSIAPFYRKNTKSYIHIYDIANINSPKLLKKWSIDGKIFTSRISRDRLNIVSSFYPSFTIKLSNNHCSSLYTKVDINKEYNIISKRIIPKASDGSKEVDLITYDNLYINPVKKYEAEFINVFSVNLENNEIESGSSIDGNINNVYSSQDNMYLSSTNYNRYNGFNNYSLGSKVFKFSLLPKISFDYDVFIKGRINSQFSFSEDKGILRVVSTDGFSWKNNTNNILSVVKNGKILSTIEGLGKKGETVKGVRFFGDIGFVVTFKQTDPLYIIDVSNPLSPIKKAELEIPGYSSYFHKISKNKLLSIGRDADTKGTIKGLQIQLFDISNLNSPYLVSKELIGDKYSYSSSLFDHKAFTYFSEHNLFSIDYFDYKNKYQGFKIFQITDKINHIQDIKRQDLNIFSNNKKRSIIFKTNDILYIGYIEGSQMKAKKITGVK